MNKCSVKDAINDGLPIIMGYIPVAMAFGILSKSSGITIMETLGLSMIVFAGASQFIAVNLLIAGASMGEIVLTTLLVNFRHFLFSASLSPKLTKDMKKAIPFIAFGLTDEVFSVASLKKKELTSRYLLVLELCVYSSFASGTALGYILGGVLPSIVQLSMGIALYALFTAILVPEMKKSLKVFILLITSGIVNTVCLYIFKIPQGWSVVISIILVSFLGMFINEKEVEVCHE